MSAKQKTMGDRRCCRSGLREEAMHFLLTQVAEDFDMEAFTVSDPHGDLWATSTSSGYGDVISIVLACHSPELFVPRLRTRAQKALERALVNLVPGWLGEDVSVQEFAVGGHRLLLTTVGEVGTMRELASFRAIMGIRRIWRETELRAAA